MKIVSSSLNIGVSYGLFTYFYGPISTVLFPRSYFLGPISSVLFLRSYSCDPIPAVLLLWSYCCGPQAGTR